MSFDIEALKLLGAALALVVSTATAQFTIASFVNKVRDEFHQKRSGRWCYFSEIYDLLWGYGLGIVFNIIFFVAAGIVRDQTANTQYASFGSFLRWLYLVNLIAWMVGIVIDLVRILLCPGTEKSKPTVVRIEK